MTVYEINYHERLNEMCNLMIHKYGFEHPRTIAFFREVEKRRPLACYQNREDLEQLFRGWMK